MPQTRIAFLDDDHIVRFARYAIGGPGEISEDWVRHFFAPDEVDLARVDAAGRGLRASDGVELIPMAAKLDPRAGGDVSILIFRRGTIDAALMDANPRLKLIQRIGGRADMIDVAAAAKRGIAVSCLPRPSLQYTAEQAILLMLALAKRLIESDEAVRNDRWDRARVHPENGVAYNWAGISNLGGLYDKTVGIIGLGEVGSLAVPMAKGFGARVIYTNRTRLSPDYERRLGVEYRPLAQLLAEADFVSMHASNLPENKGLIDGTIFAQMKPTAFFINTSRGRMVDEPALRAALEKGVIAGAGLDVHFEEPRPMPNQFAGMRNVILTPHVAGGSRAIVLEEIEAILDNCRAVLAGAPIRHQVPPR